MNEQLWQWQHWHDLPYLTCLLLGDWQHGFFTRQFSPRPPVELSRFWQPATPAYRVRQVHGEQVLTPTEIEAAGERGKKDEYESLPPADGLISEGGNQSLWVASADCTPALLGDVVTGQVAAIHAGWRGTARRIVPAAIARFLSFGSSLDDLRVALGPAIAGEVYQVTEQVAVEVGASLFKNEKIENSEAILAALQEMSDSPLIPDPQPGRIRLDVQQVNALQLTQLGLQPEQVAIAPYCTYQQPDYFFSYRRTKEKQVQWSGIVSREVLGVRS